MIIIYRFLINFILIISPIILFFRILKKKKIYTDLKKNFVFLQKKEVKVKSYGSMALALENFKV